MPDLLLGRNAGDHSHCSVGVVDPEIDDAMAVISHGREDTDAIEHRTHRDLQANYRGRCRFRRPFTLREVPVNR